MGGINTVLIACVILFGVPAVLCVMMSRPKRYGTMAVMACLAGYVVMAGLSIAVIIYL